LEEFLLFLCAGIICAFYSTLPVLDFHSQLWSNDEGLFILLAKDNGLDFDIRYGLFLLYIKLYFLFFSDFFAVLSHKILILILFLLFSFNKLLRFISK
jgi:hypothetical protein